MSILSAELKNQAFHEHGVVACFNAQPSGCSPGSRVMVLSLYHPAIVSSAFTVASEFR